MKQKILMLMMTVLCIGMVACGGDDGDAENAMESVYSDVPFAGVWNVKEVKIGGSWQDARTANYKDTQLIVAEDSCYQSSGRFGLCYGRYVVKDGKVNCLDYYRKLFMTCQFGTVSGNTTTATITNKDGVTLDFRLGRDDSNPALYLDPLKYLNGTWDIKDDEGGYVTLRGYAADIHHSQFETSYLVERSPSDIRNLTFGSGLGAYFNLSTSPYTMRIQGTCHELNGKYITLVCTKHSE